MELFFKPQVKAGLTTACFSHNFTAETASVWKQFTCVFWGVFLAAFLTVSSFTPASAVIITFELNDHPDGNKSPPYEYGLRLDEEHKFFSFDGVSTARLVVDTLLETAIISGTVIENSKKNDNVAIWDLFYEFSDITILGPDGSFSAEEGSGFLDKQGSSKSIDHLKSKQNHDDIAMLFTNELFRDFDGWNGRGWLKGDDTNDFLFTASVVPIPAALPLFGTGLAILGFFGWRRKHKTQAACPNTV